MKRFIALPAVIGLLALAASAARASAPVLRESIPVQDLSSPPSSVVVDPCNQEPITWTGNVNLVGLMTIDAAGGIMFDGHVNFQGVHGTDPTGTSYTFSLVSNEIEVLAPSSPNLGSTPNDVTKILRFQIIGDGSTPTAYEDEVGHFTILPDGTMTVSFDRQDTGCSS